jgi:hypothetical protein
VLQVAQQHDQQPRGGERIGLGAVALFHLDPKEPGQVTQALARQPGQDAARQLAGAQVGVGHLRLARAGQLVVDELQVELAVVCHDHAVAGELRQLGQHRSAGRRVAQHLGRDACQAGDEHGDAAPRVDQAVERVGDFETFHAKRRDLGNAVLRRRTAGGLEVQHGVGQGVKRQGGG